MKTDKNYLTRPTVMAAAFAAVGVDLKASLKMGYRPFKGEPKAMVIHKDDSCKALNIHTPGAFGRDAGKKENSHAHRARGPALQQAA